MTCRDLLLVLFLMLLRSSDGKFSDQVIHVNVSLRSSAEENAFAVCSPLLDMNTLLQRHEGSLHECLLRLIDDKKWAARDVVTGGGAFKKCFCQEAGKTESDWIPSKELVETIRAVLVHIGETDREICGAILDDKWHMDRCMKEREVCLRKVTIDYHKILSDGSSNIIIGEPHSGDCFTCAGRSWYNHGEFLVPRVVFSERSSHK